MNPDAAHHEISQSDALIWITRS